ncbi:MAG: hypothetical protein ACOVK6_03415 [Ramlibacter sp.]|jgi:hypothetical protein
MATCSRCQATIPSGRNFCTAHYMEAVAEYESALANYNHNIAVWNSMSDAERSAAHASAEESSVTGYAGAVGFLVGAIAWYVMAQERDIDALWGVGILVGTILVFTVIGPIRVLVGRLARMFVRAIGYFIGLWIVGAIISIWSPFIKENSSMLTAGLVIGVLVISAILEASGGHHASGAPTPPSKPSP